MDTISGVVLIKSENKGSKSEGNVAYLVTLCNDEPQIFRLYREEAFNVNDNFFIKWDKKEVLVLGEIEMSTWIKVTSITENNHLEKEGNDLQ